MPLPIVIAYHLIWTAYGWWLPNDPRGSFSHAITSDVIAELGELHYGRKKVQPAGATIREFQANAVDALRFPRLQLDVVAFPLIAQAIGEVVTREKYTCYACAVMPDHVHILIRRHKDDAESMIAKLQDGSRMRLVEAKRRTLNHPVWTAGGGWKVFLDHPEEVRRTIGYVERNPVKIRMPAQRWEFVKGYDGWPLHPGHNEKSPYVRALRAAGRYP